MPGMTKGQAMPAAQKQQKRQPQAPLSTGAGAGDTGLMAGYQQPTGVPGRDYGAGVGQP